MDGLLCTARLCACSFVPAPLRLVTPTTGTKVAAVCVLVSGTVGAQVISLFVSWSVTLIGKVASVFEYATGCSDTVWCLVCLSISVCMSIWLSFVC